MRTLKTAGVGVICLGLSFAPLALAQDRPAVRRDGVQNAQSANLMVHRVHDIVGMPVKNPAGQELGKVEDLVIDIGTGRVRYAAISVGGFLGLGDKLFAVPFSAMKVKQNAGEEQRHFVLNVDKKVLEKANGFDKKNWPDFGNPRWGADYDRMFDTAATDR